MDTPGYVILSRLGAQSRATQVLANNIANGDTPGFRAERPIFAAQLEAQRGGPARADAVAYTIDRGLWRDTRQGPLASTGNPLDLALRGEGYFAVETSGGERYTRAGRFTLDQDGQLSDADGNAVLDARGAPLTVAPGDSRIEVTGDGTLRSENGVIGQLRIVRFTDDQAMVPEGARLFRTTQDPEPLDRPQVIQGTLEGSNVSPVLEITRLTEEVRQFQFAAQFAEREGERLQGAVDRILRRRS